MTMHLCLECESVHEDDLRHRPPYGALSSDPEFDVEMARVVLARVEHEPACQDNEDTLFVELRLACDKIEQLQEDNDRLKMHRRESLQIEADLYQERRELKARIEELEAENLALKLRPSMKCVACEEHNEQLVDRIDRMVEAVCATCADTEAFRASQKWPLDPPPPMTDEEFRQVLGELDAQLAGG